jgi:hypothetical protein
MAVVVMIECYRRTFGKINLANETRPGVLEIEFRHLGMLGFCIAIDSGRRSGALLVVNEQGESGWFGRRVKSE